MIWLIRLGYLLISLICVKNTFTSNFHESDEAIKNRLKWWIITILFFLIGINSIFNFHIHLSELFREYAHIEGWYEDRRSFQMLFLAVIISFGIITDLALQSKLKEISLNNRMVIYGTAFLGSIFLFDIISFHPVDSLFNSYIFGCKIRLILELAGIIWVAVSLVLKINQRSISSLPQRESRKIRFV